MQDLSMFKTKSVFHFLLLFLGFFLIIYSYLLLSLLSFFFHLSIILTFFFVKYVNSRGDHFQFGSVFIKKK
jgi:hypothetical protein